MNRRVHPTELLQKTLQSSVSKFFTPYPTNKEIQWDCIERVKTSSTTLPRIAKRYNIMYIRLDFSLFEARCLPNKKSVHSCCWFPSSLLRLLTKTVKVQKKIFVTFFKKKIILFLWFPSAEYQNGNMQYDLYYFWSVCVWKGFLWEAFQWRTGCESFRFQNPHATKSSTGRNGAAVWVESVDNNEFTVCVLEYGDGSSKTTKISWMALQSVPVGAQLDTVSLESWTTGIKCKRIAFEKVSFVSTCVFLQFTLHLKALTGLVISVHSNLETRLKEDIFWDLFDWMSNFLYLYLGAMSCWLSVWLFSYIF